MIWERNTLKRIGYVLFPVIVALTMIGVENVSGAIYYYTEYFEGDSDGDAYAGLFIFGTEVYEINPPSDESYFTYKYDSGSGIRKITKISIKGFGVVFGWYNQGKDLIVSYRVT
ncbi:MAG: hypothetical protein ACFFCU_20255 [Promethearchaeota archaeon]